jgi:hypothetical protein
MKQKISITDKEKLSLSCSPQRNTFQKEGYLKRQAKKGLTPDNDENTRTMVEYYENWDIEHNEKVLDPLWQENNLEYDLRSVDWILEKVRNNDTYAQNLYAAMCNNDFIKNDVWPILTEKTWGCSWRYAGGIIADMRQTGDYIDWYCSGIGDGLGNGDINNDKSYVPEGLITDEVHDDLIKLGWIVAPGGDHEKF